MLIYNICNKSTPADKFLLPMSDGRFSFAEAAWQAAGFKIVAFDRDDTDAIRKLGKAIGWDDEKDDWDYENDISVLYTIGQRQDRERAIYGARVPRTRGLEQVTCAADPPDASTSTAFA